MIDEGISEHIVCGVVSAVHPCVWDDSFLYRLWAVLHAAADDVLAGDGAGDGFLDLRHSADDYPDYDVARARERYSDSGRERTHGAVPLLDSVLRLLGIFPLRGGESADEHRHYRRGGDRGTGDSGAGEPTMEDFGTPDGLRRADGRNTVVLLGRRDNAADMAGRRAARAGAGADVRAAVPERAHADAGGMRVAAGDSDDDYTEYDF